MKDANAAIKLLGNYLVIFPVVLWLHKRLSFFHYLIATVGHLLPWHYYVH